VPTHEEILRLGELKGEPFRAYYHGYLGGVVESHIHDLMRITDLAEYIRFGKATGHLPPDYSIPADIAKVIQTAADDTGPKRMSRWQYTEEEQRILGDFFEYPSRHDQRLGLFMMGPERNPLGKQPWAREVASDSWKQQQRQTPVAQMEAWAEITDFEEYISFGKEIGQIPASFTVAPEAVAVIQKAADEAPAGVPYRDFTDEEKKDLDGFFVHPANTMFTWVFEMSDPDLVGEWYEHGRNQPTLVPGQLGPEFAEGELDELEQWHEYEALSKQSPDEPTTKPSEDPS